MNILEILEKINKKKKSTKIYTSYKNLKVEVNTS